MVAYSTLWLAREVLQKGPGDSRGISLALRVPQPGAMHAGAATRVLCSASAGASWPRRMPGKARPMAGIVVGGPVLRTRGDVASVGWKLRHGVGDGLNHGVLR